MSVKTCSPRLVQALMVGGDLLLFRYEKHGTCAENKAALATELGFMSTTLQLRNKYAPLPALSGAKIVPGGSYMLSDVRSASCGHAAIRSSYFPLLSLSLFYVCVCVYAVLMHRSPTPSKQRMAQRLC